MFALCKDIFFTCIVCLVISSFCVRLSNSKVVSPCEGEKDDVISKILLSNFIFAGSVNKIYSYKTLEYCAEFEKVEFLKGELEENPLRICSVNLKCHDSLLYENKQFIIFLTSTELSVDDETNDKFYHMDSSPLPYSRKEEIETYIADALPGQSPAIKVMGKTRINESYGDRVNITCSFTGYPTPEVKWLKNGEELLPSHNVKINTNESHSIVEFTEMYIDHAGEYQCIANNIFGSDNITYTVTSYKMHAHPCSDNLYCFNHGICYFSEGHKLCECKSDFSGTRCQLFVGEINGPIQTDEGTKSLQTLLLMTTVAVVTTGVIILVYYSARSLYMGKEYKKIQANGSKQLLQEQINGDSATKIVEVKCDVPKLAAKTIASPEAAPNSPRSRLNGTSTPMHSSETVWISKGEPHKVQVEFDDDDHNTMTPPPFLSSFRNNNTVHSSNALSDNENIPFKVTKI